MLFIISGQHSVLKMTVTSNGPTMLYTVTRLTNKMLFGWGLSSISFPKNAVILRLSGGVRILLHIPLWIIKSRYSLVWKNCDGMKKIRSHWKYGIRPVKCTWSTTGCASLHFKGIVLKTLLEIVDYSIS